MSEDTRLSLKRRAQIAATGHGHRLDWERVGMTHIGRCRRYGCTADVMANQRDRTVKGRAVDEDCKGVK